MLRTLMREKNQAASELGKLGGLARARVLRPERRREIAIKASAKAAQKRTREAAERRAKAKE